METAYLTVAAEGTDEFTEQRSRFIGFAKPVKTEEEALEFVAALKKKYWDAKHHVYAYVLRDARISRSTDDGEPQGTAGVPVLDVLQKQDITDCVVVVIRYFGGILLGAGGLVRAYSKGASLAVRAAGVLERRLCTVGSVRCEYGEYGRVQPLVSEFGGIVDDSDFAEDVVLKCHLPCEQVEPFQKQLTEITAGQRFFEKERDEFFDFSKKV